MDVTVQESKPLEMSMSEQPRIAGITISPEGPEGPQGPEGLEGPQGQEGPQGPLASSVEIVQATSANLWTVAHGLGRRPASVTVYDESDNEVMTAVRVVDLNTIEISMASDMAGRVVIL